jgi:YidC/Oxa1 family membrane protein insertase
VFIALYSVLNSTIDLRRAGFVLWIDDLSSPESLFQLPFSLPFLGQDFRLLPLLMGVSMLWQQRTGSPTGAGDPRMKMMGYLMPVIFTVMFYRFPSGLVLYWLVNTVLTIAQQYLIGRGDRKGVSLEPEPPKGRRRRARTPAPAPKGTDSVDAPPAPLAAGQSSRQEG